MRRREWHDALLEACARRQGAPRRLFELEFRVRRHRHPLPKPKRRAGASLPYAASKLAGEQYVLAFARA